MSRTKVEKLSTMHQCMCQIRNPILQHVRCDLHSIPPGGGNGAEMLAKWGCCDLQVTSDKFMFQIL